MKKELLILLSCLGIGLSACGGSSAKDELIKGISSNAEKTQASYDVRLKINEFQRSSKQTSEEDTSFLSDYFNSIKGQEVKGEISYDFTDEDSTVGINLSSNQDSASEKGLDLILKNNQTFVGVEGILLGSSDNIQVKGNVLQGKYVSETDELGADTGGLKPAEIQTESKMIETMLKKIDKKRFIEKEQQITLDLTEDESKEFLDYIFLFSSMTSKAKEFESAKLVITQDKNSGEFIVDFDVHYTQDYDYTLIKGTANVKAKDYKAPQVPTAENVITLQELEKLVEDNVILSDDVFVELYDQLKEFATVASREEFDSTIEELLSELGKNMSEEQIKKLKQLRP